MCGKAVGLSGKTVPEVGSKGVVRVSEVHTKVTVVHKPDSFATLCQSFEATELTKTIFKDILAAKDFLQGCLIDRIPDYLGGNQNCGKIQGCVAKLLPREVPA